MFLGFLLILFSFNTQAIQFDWRFPLGQMVIADIDCNDRPMELKKLLVKNIDYFGSLVFINVEVPGKITVKGSIYDGKNSIVNEIELNGPCRVRGLKCKVLKNINGDVEAQNITIEKEFSINGKYLKITNAQLPDIELKGKIMNLENVTVNNVIVHEYISPIAEEKHQRDQFLSISGNTIVKGNVTINAPKCKLSIEGNAKILGTIKENKRNKKNKVPKAV